MTDDKQKKRRRRRKPKKYQGRLPDQRTASKNRGGYRKPDPPKRAPYPEYFADVEHPVDIDEIADQVAANGKAFGGGGYGMEAPTLSELIEGLQQYDPDIEKAQVRITCIDEDCKNGFRTIWEGKGVPNHLEDDDDGCD